MPKGLGILWIKTNPETPGFETVVCYPCLTHVAMWPTDFTPGFPVGSSRNGPCPELNSIAGSSDWAAFTVGEQVILCAQLLTFLGRFPKKTEIPQTLDFENPEMNDIFSILSWFMLFLMIWKGHLFWYPWGWNACWGQWLLISSFNPNTPIIFMREVLGKIILIWI